MKKYKIDYGTKFKYLTTKFVSFIINSACCTYLSWLMFFIRSFLLKLFDGNEIIGAILRILFAISILFLIVFIIVLIFIPNEVVLTPSQIYIKKSYINISYIFRGVMNERILYSQINYCKLDEGPINLGPFRLDLDFTVWYFNRESLVAVEDNRNRRYYIPVENAEEFVEEVNKRMQEAKASRLSD